MKMKVYNPGAPLNLIVLGQEVKLDNREMIFLDMNVGNFLQQLLPGLECQPVENEIATVEGKALQAEKERKKKEAEKTAKANAEYTAKTRANKTEAEVSTEVKKVEEPKVEETSLTEKKVLIENKKIGGAEKNKDKKNNKANKFN